MKRRFTLMLYMTIVCSFAASAQWINLEMDATGDGENPSLLDGIEYEYMHDLETDSLWFRITTTGISDEQSTNVGVNIMVWYPTPGAEESLFNFWSPGNSLSWNRLLTTWVTGTAPADYSGTTGISRGDDVNASNYNGLVDDVSITVNQDDSTIIIGTNRSDLIPDDQLGELVEISAAVGSSMAFNDDLISQLYFPNIILESPIVSSTKTLFTNETLDISPNPANSEITIQLSSNQLISSYEIHSITGTMIRSSQIDLTNTTTIDISSLAEGIYILNTFENGQLNGSNRVIKL